MRGVLPSPLWGGDGGGGSSLSRASCPIARPPSPTLPQPAAGLPASRKSKKSKNDRTPAGRGSVGGGSTPRLPLGFISPVSQYALACRQAAIAELRHDPIAACAQAHPAQPRALEGIPARLGQARLRVRRAARSQRAYRSGALAQIPRALRRAPVVRRRRRRDRASRAQAGWRGARALGVRLR